MPYPAHRKAFFCLTYLEHHDRKSRSDPRRDQIRSCTVPSLLQTHRIMAVRRQHKTHLASTLHKLNLLLHEPLLCPNNYLCFSAKGLPVTHTRVKLLSYSFSSNTVQSSRLFDLIQSTKDLLLLFLPKRHYRHPGYTTNIQKYTNKSKDISTLRQKVLPQADKRALPRCAPNRCFSPA